LIEDAEPLEEILELYKTNYEIQSSQMMRSKIGLFTARESDDDLLASLQKNLQASETDMTIFFRNLSQFQKAYPKQGIEIVQDSFYKPKEIEGKLLEEWNRWFENYAERLKNETLSDQQRKIKMNEVNPKYVLRNYMAQLAIEKADKGDYSLIETFYQLLKNPYKEQPESIQWFAKRPEWARHKIGCSMLSCSS
jgi:uncharacterized protein YdiU (UPF0061 family)